MGVASLQDIRQRFGRPGGFLPQLSAVRLEMNGFSVGNLPDVRFTTQSSEAPHLGHSPVICPAQPGMLPMASILACHNWEQAASAAVSLPRSASAGENGPGMDEVGAPAQRKKRQQCAAACIPCAKSKSACDNNRPCKRCMRQNKGKLCFDKVRPYITCFCCPSPICVLSSG